MPGDLILLNEQFVSYYGIRHIISHETKLFTKKCIHKFNVAHCKCTDMKFDFEQKSIREC